MPYPVVSNLMPAYPQLAHPVGFQSPFTLATHTDSAGYTLPALANLDSSVYLPIAAEDPSNDLGNPIAFSAHGQHTISATFNGTTLHLMPGTTSVNSATGIPFASTPQWVDLHFHTSNQAFVTVTLDNAVSRWAFNPTNGVLNQHRQYSIPKTTVRTITRNNNPYTYHIELNRNMLAIADTSRSQMHRYPAPFESVPLAFSCIENPAANGFTATTVSFTTGSVYLSEFLLNSNLGYLNNGLVRFIPLPTNIGYTKDATATLQRNGNMVAISLFQPNKGATQFIGQIGSDFSLTNLQKRTDSTATALVPLYVEADGTAVAEHDGTTITWDGTGAPPDGPLCNLQRERNINSYEEVMSSKTQEPLNTNNPGDPSYPVALAEAEPQPLKQREDHCNTDAPTIKPTATQTVPPTDVISATETAQYSGDSTKEPTQRDTGDQTSTATEQPSAVLTVAASLAASQAATPTPEPGDVGKYVMGAGLLLALFACGCIAGRKCTKKDKPATIVVHGNPNFFRSADDYRQLFDPESPASDPDPDPATDPDSVHLQEQSGDSQLST